MQYFFSSRYLQEQNLVCELAKPVENPKLENMAEGCYCLLVVTLVIEYGITLPSTHPILVPHPYPVYTH